MSVFPEVAGLLSEGFVILRDAIDPRLVDRLNVDLDDRFAATPFCEGSFYGERTKRFGSLLIRSPAAAAFVQHPVMLDLARAMLESHCDRIALNLTQALEIHPSALAQYPHKDEDMWGGAKGEIEYLINVIWPLSPFTRDNGATRLWPQSRESRGDALEDGDAVYAEMDVGDALVFLGSTFHGGGANHTELPRRALVVSYCLGWLKPFELQWLVYPPAVARQFSPDLAALVGYAQHRPNLGNVEGQCPSIMLKGGDLDGLPAIDALLPEQASALANYVAEQEAARAGLLGG